jgi:hypothetical protein
MARNRMLADVLWEAANERLSPVYHNEPAGMDPFSCNAVGLAVRRCTFETKDRIHDFLRSLGCSGHAGQMALISGLEHGEEALQGCRFMWLLLAMHVAEDEGITV